MLSHSPARRGLSARIARTTILPLVLCLTLFLAPAPIDAGDPPAAPATPTTPAPAASSLTLALAESVHMALERQPRIAAARASLAAAEDGKRALDALRIPEIVDREIPVRRRQAALGVTAAAAAVDQAERETVYAVTRTFFTVLYAREQDRVARGVVDRLTATYESAQQQLKSGARDVSATDVNRSLTYLRLAQAKRTQAAQGEKRALAALKEAIGLCPDVVLDVPQGPLPQSDFQPSREEIVAAAQARRGELIQANIFSEVTCLEVEAQGTSTHRRMETFAAGSDIHSRLIPPGSHNNEYRPAGIPPEMPTLLVGTRPERVKHAQSLHARAGAVAEATRNLIALEAEDAFLRWEEASRQVSQAREAAEAGEKLAEDLSKDFTAGLRVKVEDVVSSRVLASQARAQYNEYLYQEILALADLERVTAGAFNAALVEAPAPPASGGSAPPK
jgi:outer membrane protein TolC